MLDISRGRVPTSRRWAGSSTCSPFGRINHVELYTDHTFAYRHHRPVWEGASPLEPADVRWLDRRCAERGITLVANQNCFGHMGQWLRHHSYRWRAECPDGFLLGTGQWLAPSTLLSPAVAGALAELGIELGSGGFPAAVEAFTRVGFPFWWHRGRRRGTRSSDASTTPWPTCSTPPMPAP
ncbi:hypothetical protein BH24ACT3_BH24ACT3_04130 [soil metagenome]